MTLFYSSAQRWCGVCLWWNLDSAPLTSGCLKGAAVSYCWKSTSFAIIVRCWKLTFFLSYLLTVSRSSCLHKIYQVCQSCERGKRPYWSALLMESILKSLSQKYFRFSFFCGVVLWFRLVENTTGSALFYSSLLTLRSDCKGCDCLNVAKSLWPSGPSTGFCLHQFVLNYTIINSNVKPSILKYKSLHIVTEQSGPAGPLHYLVQQNEPLEDIRGAQTFPIHLQPCPLGACVHD